MLVQHSDYIYAQVKMNPCGDDFICGQPVLGPELILNGNFATNLDNWTVDAGWAWSAAQACATNGQNIGQTIGAGLIDGNSYMVAFTITNYVSNDLSFSLGGTTSGPYNANGTYSVIVVAGASDEDLIFGGSGTFNGCIVNVSLREMPECWNSSFPGDDPFTYTPDGICVTGTGNLFTDTLTNTPGYYVASFTISNYTSGTIQVSGACIDTWVGGPFSSNGEKFAYGVFAAPGVLCFEFKVTNGTFDTDLSDWNAGSGWAWDITNGGEAVFDRNAGTGSLSQAFSVSDINVCARITVYDIVGSGAFVRLTLRNAANNVVTDLDITAPGVYTICGLGNQIAVEPSNTTGMGVEVDNIGIFQITDCADCSPYDYCSNCIKFAESFDTCVLLVESYNNENGSWGFVWNNAAGTNIFKLSHRLPSKLWHPLYPEESNDYTFSDGKTSDTFAQSDKVWTLGIDPESERTHDVIRLQKRSDHFVITDINESREFWAEKGDYNPDWPDGGCKAPVNINVKLKTSTLFNNLCTT
jgi:hypothetical protein